MMRWIIFTVTFKFLKLIWKVRFWRDYIKSETQRANTERVCCFLHHLFQISEQTWKRDSTTLLPPTPENCHRRSESDVTKPSALATLLVLAFSLLIPLSLGSLSPSLKFDFSYIHFSRFEFYMLRLNFIVRVCDIAFAFLSFRSEIQFEFSVKFIFMYIVLNWTNQLNWVESMHILLLRERFE